MFGILVFLLFISILAPFAYLALTAEKNRKRRFKPVLTLNLITFFGVLLISTFFIFTNTVSAETQDTVAAAGDFSRGMAYLAAALVTGMCTIGTGIATGQAASSAIGAISENEKIMAKALIFVSLAEGIAIYGLLISFTILSRV